MKGVKYTLPVLDYGYSALEPYISARIMELHHSKHHQSYVDGANKALALLEEMRESGNMDQMKAVLKELSFNQNGHLLHSVFWKNMIPNENQPEISSSLTEALEENFGSIDSFKAEFAKAASTVEGSGWAVLGVSEDGLLVYQVEKHNLMHPVGFRPALVLDVWEHAYYLDYENKRADYIEAFWNVVNWDDVARRVEG